jgi:hypothetical protein
MVPASRRVTEASLLPPESVDRKRAIKLAGTGLADRASITATAEIQTEPPQRKRPFSLSTIR